MIVHSHDRYPWNSSCSRLHVSVFDMGARLDIDSAGCDGTYLQLTGDCFSLSPASLGPPTTTAIHASCECLQRSQSKSTTENPPQWNTEVLTELQNNQKNKSAITNDKVQKVLFWSWSGDFTMGLNPELNIIPDRGPLKWHSGFTGSLTGLDFQAVRGTSHLSHPVSPSAYSSR